MPTVLFNGGPDMVKLRGKDPKKARPPRCKALVFGEAGVGKTWASLDFPSVYYIDTEGGASLDHYTDKLKKVGAAYMGPEDGACDYSVVLEQVQGLATQKHDYRTLVIDSFTKLYNTEIAVGEDEILRSGGDLSKTFGREKKNAIKCTRQLVRWLDKINMNVLLICHAKTEWKDGEAIGETFDGWDKLKYEFSLALHVRKQGPQRVAVPVKSRLLEFPEGKAFPWSFDEIAKRMGALDAEAEAIDPATPEQVAEIQRLVKVVNVEPATIDKWWEKAGVESWERMTNEDIQKCIDHLTSQTTGKEAA